MCTSHEQFVLLQKMEEKRSSLVRVLFKFGGVMALWLILVANQIQLTLNSVSKLAYLKKRDQGAPFAGCPKTVSRKL